LDGDFVLPFRFSVDGYGLTAVRAQHGGLGVSSGFKTGGAMEIIPVLGQISGQSVVWAIIWLIIMGVVFWLLNWLIGYVGIPEPFSKVAKVVLAVAAVIAIISILMGLAGHPLFRW